MSLGSGSGSGTGTGTGSIPMLGVCCQGSYCISGGERDILVSRNSKERRKSQTSRGGNTVCPYQMTFKSVLLDRAEEKLLGTCFKDKLKEDIIVCEGKVRLCILWCIEVLYLYLR